MDYKYDKIMYLRLQSQYGGKKLKSGKYWKTNNNTRNKIQRSTMQRKHTEKVSEPWFSLISLGLKTVEGRKNSGKFKEFEVGDIIEWTNNDFKPRSVMTKITKKVEYKSFEEYLREEGLDKCLPGMPSIEHGLSVYYKYYTKEQEEQFGVVAIHMVLFNE